MCKIENNQRYLKLNIRFASSPSFLPH